MQFMFSDLSSYTRSYRNDNNFFTLNVWYYIACSVDYTNGFY